MQESVYDPKEDPFISCKSTVWGYPSGFVLPHPK